MNITSSADPLLNSHLPYPVEVFPKEYLNSEELNQKIERIKKDLELVPIPLAKNTKRLLETAENQDRIKDFCAYVELGYTLVSGSIEHFVGNLLIYGSKYEIFKNDLSHLGHQLQQNIAIGSSVADGLFNTQRLVDILIRKERLNFAKKLSALISEKNSDAHAETLAIYKKNLDCFIINEEKNLLEAQLYLGTSMTRCALSSVSDFLRNFQSLSLIAAPFQWASSILGIVASSLTLHYALKHQKIQKQWIARREEKPNLALDPKGIDHVQRLLTKRKGYFENLWKEWNALASFEALAAALKPHGISLEKYEIKTIEQWRDKTQEAHFQEEVREVYLAKADKDRQRADLIKQLSLAKHRYQKREVDFNTTKTKILFGVGLAATLTSVALTILVFFSIIALPGFVLGFPALALFAATACLFLVGIHRMRTQRPLFFKNYFSYRVRYLFNLISTFFKQVKLSHLTKEKQLLRRRILRKIAESQPNLQRLASKVNLYFCKEKERENLERAIAESEKNNKTLYSQLNCYRSVDFLNRHFKQNLRTPEQVKNFLTDHLENIFESEDSSRVLKTLYKDMGIQAPPTLKLSQSQDKLIAAILEFLGQSEEGLLYLIRNQTARQLLDLN